MVSRVSPADDRLGAYCDDVFLVAKDILAALRAIAPCFSIASKELNFALNAKTSNAFQYASPATMTSNSTSGFVIFEGMKFCRALLLLGVWLGPEAHKIQWEKSANNMKHACLRVAALNVGTAASIPL